MKRETTNKCRTDECARWSIMIPDYSLQDRKKVEEMAKKNRRSVGGYVAMLLDKALREESTAM